MPSRWFGRYFDTDTTSSVSRCVLLGSERTTDLETSHSVEGVKVCRQDTPEREEESHHRAPEQDRHAAPVIQEWHPYDPGGAAHDCGEIVRIVDHDGRLVPLDTLNHDRWDSSTGSKVAEERTQSHEQEKSVLFVRGPIEWVTRVVGRLRNQDCLASVNTCDQLPGEWLDLHARLWRAGGCLQLHLWRLYPQSAGRLLLLFRSVASQVEHKT